MCAFILQPEKCCLLDKAYLEEVRSGSELVFGVFSRIVPRIKDLAINFTRHGVLQVKKNVLVLLSFSRKSNNLFDQVFALIVRWAERMVFSEEAKGLFNFPFNKGVWMLERAFQII